MNYQFEAAGPDDAAIDEGPLELLLNAARRAGTISQFDTGRGRLVWFEGCTGKALRVLRARVRSAIEAAKGALRGEG